MKSGAISIDRYAGGEPAEQFDFLYENFSILQELLKDYREELIILDYANIMQSLQKVWSIMQGFVKGHNAKQLKIKEF